MIYKENWNETRQRFIAWWDRSCLDRPMMRVVARRDAPAEALETEIPFASPEAYHLDAAEKVKRYRNFMRGHRFLAEAFPNLDLNIGPGSLAVYLGSQPEFAWDTVWYRECIDDPEAYGLPRYDGQNPWWIRHLALIRQAKALSRGDFLVNIPDLIENIDILAAMRGPQALCYDLMDRPRWAADFIGRLDDLYFSYYDAMYDAVRAPDGSSSYTAFQLWGPGKTAKVQCDFCALLSPDQFRQFVQPYLRQQCRSLDHSMYHLDGPDAIRHLPVLMEINELDALQWTAGAGQPDGANPKWYTIYDTVKKAGKSLWISIYDGGFSDWIDGAGRLVKRYGPEGLYLLFPVMSEEEAARLLETAEREWK